MGDFAGGGGLVLSLLFWWCFGVLALAMGLLLVVAMVKAQVVGLVLGLGVVVVLV
jgi:hypothetical protein